MGFRNNNLGFPSELLSSRAVVKKGEYALLTPDGMVNNVIPGFINCDTTILSSPKIGATFVDYLLDIKEGGSVPSFGGDGVETFAYVIHGEITAGAGDEKQTLTTGGYVYCPPSKVMSLENKGKEVANLFLYKRRYVPAKGYDEPPAVFNNINNLEAIAYEDMENVKFYNFLPSVDNLSFDMNFHILAFEDGGSHGYVETHVQEHGAYILSGRGMYNLGNDWMPVMKGDYIFMGAYVQQAAYAVSKDASFSYIYSKDCNRDENI